MKQPAIMFGQMILNCILLLNAMNSIAVLEEISIVEIGIRQSSTNPHYIHKTVVKPEFTDRTKYYILGLCVANDAFIPENVVIGEYTGKIVKNMKSQTQSHCIL